MKRLSIFVSLLLTLFLSCTKKENLLEKPQEDSTSIEQFSILLSKVSSRTRVKTYSTGAVDAQIIPFYE